MTTKRTPVNRKFRQRITPRAVKLFGQMEAIGYCEEWWDLHSQLCDEMGTMPWEFPCVRSPDEANPYAAGSHAARHWQKEYEADVACRERYDLLRAALDDAHERWDYPKGSAS